jgi:hypothetical protein
MPRLIDGDALETAVLGEAWYDNRDEDIAYELIQRAPTIKPRRGEWEVAIGYDPNKKVQCQSCYKMAYEPTAYCPNCGAKMEDKP